MLPSSSIIPYLTQSQYAAPGIRMSALQRLPTLHIATHDSIGTGADGPTHQPISLAAFYRSLPNMLYIRPCDSEEVAGAFALALENMAIPNSSRVTDSSRDAESHDDATGSHDTTNSGSATASQNAASSSGIATSQATHHAPLIGRKTTMISLSRHALPQYHHLGFTSRAGVAKGA